MTGVGKLTLKEEVMLEENENAKMSKAKSTVDDSKKLSEDARGLGPMHAGSIVIGLVDEIVGEGGVEVPGCVATQYEWLQIVKLRAAEMIDLDFSYFLYGCTGSSEWRTREYANRRLKTIAKSIGEEEVKKAFKQAEQEFARTVDQRAWKIFAEGTKEEQECFQEEIAREMSGTESREVTTRITELMNALALDHPVAEQDKAVRFALLRSPAAVVSDPACSIVPILHYVNADAEGHYRKDDTGSVPPIHWELRYLGVSPLEMRQIQKLPGTGQAVDDIDIVMLRPDSAAGREFSRASTSARWKKNPDLVAEVEKAAAEVSSALAAKVAGRNGATMFDNFQPASGAIG
jgi:hypothetical protein